MMIPLSIRSLVLFTVTASLSLVWFNLRTYGSLFIATAFPFTAPALSALTTTTTAVSDDRLHRSHARHYPLFIASKEQRENGARAEKHAMNTDEYTNNDNDGDDDNNNNNNMRQLRKRFEEAMRRRDERLSRMEESTTLFIQHKSDDTGDSRSIDSLKIISEKEQIESSSDDAPGDYTYISSNRNNVGTKERKSMHIEKDDESAHSYSGESRFLTIRSLNKKNDFYRPSKSSIRSSAIRDDGQDCDDYERQSADPYSDKSEKYADPYPGYNHDLYDDDDDDDIYYEDDEKSYSTQSDPSSFEWETYQSTSILFPPPLLHSERRSGNPKPLVRPNAIIHFVGGTFFGSYPRKFYGSLLEDIASQCNAVVVATPIPLVLPGSGLINQVGNWILDESISGKDEDFYSRRIKDGREERKRRGNDVATNPLDHLSLAKAIQKEFNNAYRDVILDEYCQNYDNDKEIEEFMRNIPIVGIGHSLGARIQAISCSHPQVSKRYLSMGKGNRLIRSGREGMIYLGFANWGASSSIPGVATLDQTIQQKKQRHVIERQDRRGKGVGRRDDVWDYRSRRRRQDTMIGDDVRGRSGRYDQYDADDLDLADVFGGVLSSIAEGAKQIGEAITPQAEDLEFSPTPNDLWDDLSTPDGWYSRSCRNNLIVQFENDPIDQGSRLAKTLLRAYNNEVAEGNSTSSATENFSNDERDHQVKFARLPGGHLTPVTLHGRFASSIPRGIVSLLSSSYNFLLEQPVDRRMEKTNMRQKKEVKDVVDSVATYIQSLKCEK